MDLSKLQEIVEDRGTWCAAVHGVTKNQTWFRDWTTIKREPQEPRVGCVRSIPASSFSFCSHGAVHLGEMDELEGLGNELYIPHRLLFTDIASTLKKKTLLLIFNGWAEDFLENNIYKVCLGQTKHSFHVEWMVLVSSDLVVYKQERAALLIIICCV